MVISKNDVQNDPLLSDIIKDDVNMVSWAGETNTKRIIVYPVDFGKQFSVVCGHPEGLFDKETSQSDEDAAIGISYSALNYRNSELKNLF